MSVPEGFLDPKRKGDSRKQTVSASRSAVPSFLSLVLTVLLLLVGGLEAACLASRTAPLGGSPGASTALPSSGSDPMTFSAGECTLPIGSATTTEPLADNFHVVVQIPSGWTREPGRPSETQLLVIDAPKSYPHQPTSIEVLSLLGYFPNQSPHDIAPQYYGPSHPGVPSVQLVGAVTDCRVQNDLAAFFQYSQGDRGGYLVLFLHAYYLYGVRVEGSGGVDPRAIHDAKQVLGSVRWTVTTPPPR